MKYGLFLAPLLCVAFDVPLSVAASPVAEPGIQCRIDALSFDGDPDLTEIDYVIPPGGKPPKFRILAGHSNGDAGTISVQMKTKGAVAVGSMPLSQEPLWKSVMKLPKQMDSAVSSGEIVFSHFDPHGDQMAAGTLQFTTADGHRGDCHFSLIMHIVDLGGANLSP